MKKIKNNNAITLISLVVTIIVLMILAGVSISTISGQDGIIKKANEASDSVRIAQIEEAISMWEFRNKNGDRNSTEKESLTDYLERIEVITSEEKQEAIENGEIIIGNEVVNINKIEVESIVINGESEVEQNAEIQLTAEVSPSNATKKDVTWSSSDNSIATVDSTGKVKGIAPGNVIITAVADGKQTTKTINVPKV